MWSVEQNQLSRKSAWFSVTHRTAIFHLAVFAFLLIHNLLCMVSLLAVSYSFVAWSCTSATLLNPGCSHVNCLLHLETGFPHACGRLLTLERANAASDGGLQGRNLWFCSELLSWFLRNLFSHNMVIKAEIQVGEPYCFSNYTNYLCLAKWMSCLPRTRSVFYCFPSLSLLWSTCGLSGFFPVGEVKPWA